MTDALTGQRAAIVRRMEAAGLIAIIRAGSSAGLIEICRALHDGGVEVSEITMTTPGALGAITAADREFGRQCLIGVGSVLDDETAIRAIDAGARFVVGPTLKQKVVEAAHARGVPVLPGALSPTEVLAAWEGGADLVKVFPANHFGPRYFKDLLAPMPHLRLTPTGGVDLGTIQHWFDAGAACVGVGSALVRKSLITNGDWPALTDLARQFVDAVNTARSGPIESPA